MNVSVGIITAADESISCFSAFKLMYASLQLTNPHLPITMVDLGMVYDQRRYIESLDNVFIFEGRDVGPCPFPIGLDRWQAWNKPCYMKASPYELSLWLDTDCIICRPVDTLLELGRQGMTLVEDSAELAFPTAKETLPNKAYLYKKFPVDFPLPDGPFVNTGVLSYVPHRDSNFFDKWIELTYECASDPILRDAVSWWDQGVCQWVVEYWDLADIIFREPRWNHAGNPILRDPTRLGPFGFEFIDRIPVGEAYIAHFAGYPKPWGNLTNIPLDTLKAKLERVCVNGKKNHEDSLDSQPTDLLR